MKLRELVKITGVSRETIQFYLRDGILPKPRKRDRGQADYGEHYVELLQLIKDLQEKHFLPLAVIKKIVRRLKKTSPSEEHYFRLQSEFFSPVEQFLSQQEIDNEEEFRKNTGLSRKWLARAEEWNVITPEHREGKKIYCPEDVAIGKVMVEMDNAGLGPKDGFDPEVLRLYRDHLHEMVEKLNRRFTDQLYGRVSEEEFSEIGSRALNLMTIYFFFLYRKLAQKDTKTHIEMLEQGKDV